MPAARPPGRFIVLVGPDGVGKTTLAAALADALDGRTAYFHFRPLVWSPLLSRPPVGNPPNPDKGSAGGFAPLGWVRLARNVVRLWAGYLMRVRPAVRRGTLVIGDRWAYGYLAQPHALKYYGPPWLARLAIRLLPGPDLVVSLTAPPALIRSRKDELPEDRIVAELSAWAAAAADTRLLTLDATSTPAALAASVAAELGYA